MIGTSYSVSAVDCAIEGCFQLGLFFRLSLGEGYPQKLAVTTGIFIYIKL
jgi:hypothetical protein